VRFERLLHWWLPVAVYMAGLFIASADSTPPMPARVSDKSLHLVAYAGLAIVVCRAVARGLPARLTRRAAVAALLITIGYAATDELHQSFVPNRSADVYDLLADAAGACAGLFACWAWGIIAAPNRRVPTSTTGAR
jgi:VanZ family protein